jgi:Toxin co-regulated pilus biosynthesis protein Q
MQTTTIMENHRRIRVSTNAVAAFALLFLTTWSHAAMEPQPSSGDGWQVLTQGAPAPASRTAQAALPSAVESASLAVAPVILPGGPASGGQTLTLTIAPQDINLRNALDRWLQTQGWQLAWKIDDDLPLEFNASFAGDFTSVLTQVMKATNHMRTPTRICRHTNNVIRVIARAANCKD